MGIKLWIFFAIYLLAVQNANSEQGISVVGDEWPPYNAVPNSTTEGYFIDILREIFESKGIEVNYIVKPWNRAVRDVASGQDTALLGPFKSEAPGFVFPKQEVGISSLVFFTTSSSSWNFRGVSSLENIVIGVINGYDYRPWLMQHIQNSPNFVTKLSGENAIERNLKMLILGRIDAIPSNYASFMYRAKLLGVEKDVRFAGKDYNGEAKKLFIAFSPKLEESNYLAATFDAGMIRLRSTGRLDEILNQYGLKDWRASLE